MYRYKKKYYTVMTRINLGGLLLMIKNIYDTLSKNNLNEAFQLISNYEKELCNNSIYWCLRGDLCCLLNEFSMALSCYEKSISLNILNTIPFSRIIDIQKGYQNFEQVEYYTHTLNSVRNSLYAKISQHIAKDLNLSTHNDNLVLINDNLSSINKTIYYLKDDFLISNNDCIPIPYYFDKDNDFYKNSTILIPLNSDYIRTVNKLISYGVENFTVILLHNRKLYNIEINKESIEKIKKYDRDNTIVFHILNEGDSNVFGLYNNIPANFKNKYNRVILRGTKDYNLFNMVFIPLIASISVSGHELFINYPCPQLMHNIEVGHGSMPLKACGALDKIPNFAFSPDNYKKVDTLCVLSQTDLILWRAFTEMHPSKILISGTPRTDTLINSNGKLNLERLLNMKLKNKKVIFNMPTFHNHENSGRVNGDSSLSDFIKIPNFNYKEFDKFLGENNYICILKVHHAEQSLISKKNKLNNFKNIYAISNLDLQKHNLDLYEILNAGDLLITDYSTVYSDFLFMNKPIVFTNYDIEEYRANRGIALEPYDFWTAGPKVQNQNNLQQEISNSLTDKDYYLEKRKELKSVFFKYDDNNSSKRIWEHIDLIANKK